METHNPAKARRDYLAAQTRARIAALHLRGYSQQEIADEAGIHQSRVSRHLKRIHQGYIKTAQNLIARRKARDLIKLDQIELEMWQAWEKSKDEGPGDPRYLAEIRGCIKERAKVLGFYAPTKVETTPEAPKPERKVYTRAELEAMPYEEVVRIYNEELRAAGGNPSHN